MNNLKLYRGVWIRPDMRADSAMVKESMKNYAFFRFTPESKVLDLGGNIGAFGFMALKAGVKPENYTVFEPDPENMVLIKKNTHESCDFRQAVTTMSKDPTLTFYQTESSNRACSGTATPHGKRSISLRKIRYEVTNQYLPDILNSIKPTHLKMDIEGAETDWLEENEGDFPSCVQELAIEIHHVDTIKRFDEDWLPNWSKDFDLIHASSNHGFANESSSSWKFKNLGISGKGALFGIDLLLRRK